MEWHWQVDQLHRWTRPGTTLMLDGEMSIQDPWWKLERALLTEAKAQRTARLANREHHQHLIAGIDWHTYRQMIRTMPGEDKPHLRTGPRSHPLQRRWQTQALPHLPGPGYTEAYLMVVQVAPNSTSQNGQSASSLRRKRPYGMPAGFHLNQRPYQGHGTWKDLQPLAPHQYQGWACNTVQLRSAQSALGVRPLCLCVHNMSMGQLQRLGAITGIPTPPHTKTRALMAGLVALAKHTTTAVRVIVQMVTVWEAWTQPKHRGPFLDQLEQLTDADFQRVTVLYVCRNTRTPEAPGNEPQLRRRQRDAALVAWERAKDLQDSRQEEWQQVLDEDHKLIYTHAVARLAKIYNNKDHYIQEGYLFLFFLVSFWIFLFFVASGFWLLWLLAFVAFGFCGFWLLGLLAFVASVAFGFCGFWLFGLSIYLSIPIYLSIYLSFFPLAAVLLSLFVFAFPVVFVAETKPNEEASKQASKPARAAHLWIWCAAGGALRPPPTPPAPRHPRLPRNQYFKVNSPVQKTF